MNEAIAGTDQYFALWNSLNDSVKKRKLSLPGFISPSHWVDLFSFELMATGGFLALTSDLFRVTLIFKPIGSGYDRT